MLLRVPNIIAASIAVSFVGFFTGPLFATVGVSIPATIHLANEHGFPRVYLSAQSYFHNISILQL